MPAFTFNGFPLGSAVAISAAQSGNAAANSVSTWGQGNMGSLDILKIDSGELVAPAAIWFEAINITGFDVPAGAAPGDVYEPGYHEITYIWDFGDAGGFSPALNMPSAWNDRNVAYGRNVAHVFDAPGTYSVTCTAIDSTGTTGTAQISVTVQDPAVAYAGSRTILVDPLGAGDAATYPGAQVFTTVPAAVSAFENLGQTGRILLKRGWTYPNVNIGISTTMDNFRMGAWGSGAKPVLQPETIASSNSNSRQFIFQVFNASPVSDFMIYDLDLQGSWDASTESGDPRDEALYWLTHTGGSNPVYAVHACDFSGFTLIAFSNISRTDGFTSVFSEVSITNWRDYGMFGHEPQFGSGNRFALIGSSARQSTDACEGPLSPDLGKDGFSNDHGPFRTSTWDKVYIDACSFYSRNGWSGGPAGRTAAQPCIRVNTKGSLGAKWYISRVACEGGWLIIDADGENDSFPDNPMNFVIDKALLVATAQTVAGIALGSSGTTFRNIAMVAPDVPYEATLGNFISHTIGNPQNGVLGEPVRLHNLTFLNLGAGYDIGVTAGSGSWTNYTEENNVVHAPNAPISVTADAPIDTTTGIEGFTAVYPGKRVSTQKVVRALSGNVANGGNVASIPYPTGTAQADFAGADSHAVLVNGTDYYFADRGEISVAFGASSITVTNNSGATWTSGANIICNFKRILHSTDGATASPATVPLPRPLPGSPAETAAGGLLSYDDALGALQAPSPARGALRPA